MKETTIAARINAKLAERLAEATDRVADPYAPSITQLVERGLELALAELAKKRGKK